MQQLHFVTLPSAGSSCASYALELSLILREAGFPVEHWIPDVETDAGELFTAGALVIDPCVKKSKTLGKALTTPTNTEEVQNFSREIGTGIIVLSAEPSPELTTVIAFLRASIGRKIVLILHDVQEHPDDALIQSIVRLCHLMVFPTYLDLASMTARGIQEGESFAIPQKDDYPAIFLHAVRTSPRLQTPLVSVVTTCYNQAEFIGDALRSIQSQTLDSWECLLVDDSSSDNSLSVITPFTDDPRIKAVSMDVNGGPASARNVGIQQMHPSSEYVIFLDGDDVLEPEHMEHLITALVRDSSLIGTYGQLTFITEDGLPSEDRTNLPLPTPLADRLTGQMMATSCGIYPPSAAIFHRWAVEAAGPFNTTLHVAEDWEWVARCLTHGDLYFTGQKVVRYRLHENNSHRSEGYTDRTVEVMQKYAPSLFRASFREPSEPVLFNRDVLHYTREQTNVQLQTPRADLKIGVVIAAYNADSFLKETLKALKGQSFKNWECVVVNDGSTDKTWDVIKPFLSDKRFRRVTQFNSGTAAARNKGVEHLSDEVTHLLFLDADDLVMPDALITMLSAIQALPHAPAVFGLLEFMDVNGKDSEAPNWYDSAPSDGTVDWYDAQRFTSFNPIVTPGCVLIDRRVWNAVGPFREDLKWIEDWGLWADISTFCPVARLRVPVLRYRRHENQKTANPKLRKELEKRGPGLVTEAHHALATGQRRGWHYDPLLRTRVRLPLNIPQCDRAICTAASAGYGPWLAGLFSSLKRHGNVPDVSLFVFNIGDDPEVRDVAAWWGATSIPVEFVAKPAAWSKSILYSAASLLQSGHILCLDTDMHILGDISGLFTVVDTCAQSSIFVVRDGLSKVTLRESWTELYGGTPAEILRLNLDGPLGKYPLTVNDGLMLGSCRAFLSLESVIRQQYHGRWDILETLAWRNQIFSNLAMAQLNCAVELGSEYNTQIHAHKKNILVSKDNIQNVKAFHQNHPVKVLHYTGLEKEAHPDVHKFYRELTPSTAIMTPEPE